MNLFEQLGVTAELAARLAQGGITEPTPIQLGAIPIVLAGHDLVGQAQTGTGKTLAFILPMMQRLDAAKPKLQGLILAPTRELALQITNELKRWTSPDLKIVAIYGGQDVEAQMRRLENGAHIAVATPGRLLDHMRRETISLGSISMLVLDEADQMLHMGFLSEVESIIERIPSRRQTMLFSATMPDQIRALAKRYMKEPQDVTVKAAKVTVEAIKQQIIVTTDRRKQEALKAVIDQNPPYLGMIFCRTKRRAQALTEALLEAGYAVDELHGDLSQAKREQVMRKFREARLQLLVATDIAARGLDVEGVTHVYNYDVPLDTDSYIHRIGRTGRAGGDGLAVTFLTAKDVRTMEAIERSIGQTLPRRDEFGPTGKVPKATGAASTVGSGGPATASKTRRPSGTSNKPNSRKAAAAKASRYAKPATAKFSKPSGRWDGRRK